MASKGKGKRMRPRYDPELAQAMAKRRKKHVDLKDELEEVVSKTTDIAVSLLSSDDILQCTLSEKALEVLLIATVGLEGLLNLRHAMSMVPQNVPDRSTRIVSLVTEQVQVSPDRIKRCIQLIEKLHVVEGHYQRSLSPPVSCCINEKCHMQGKFGSLVKHHDPTTVTVYTLAGPEVAMKQALKCKGCSFIYNYSMYGKKLTEGERYHSTERDLLEVSDTSYCERELFEFFCSLSLHCWVSFSGFTEAYYDYCRHFQKQRSFDDWWTKCEGHKPQLTRKIVSDMFYTGELEKEMREQPQRLLEWTFQRNDDRDMYLQKIVEEQRKQLYPHTQASSCYTRGCGRCWSMDGNWKLCFPHCMFPVSSSVPNLSNVRFPNVCPEPLKPKSAFCIQHYSKAQTLGYPTDVKGFLSYCGAAKTAGKLDDSDGSQEETEVEEGKDVTFDAAVKQIAATSSVTSDAMLVSQGTADFVQQFPSVVDSCEPEPSNQAPTCRKDLGEKRKLRLWSRGHLFIVRPCGHVDLWRPIYRSESPSQVFLIVISWLFEILQSVPQSDWSSIILSYDNMCHLDGLRAATAPLPLPQPYNTMWKEITKVIDNLHIKNHRDEECRKKYHPKKVLEANPNYNFMIAEQTFAWLSRYKKIVCSMDKLHHLFFLHRIVSRRNKYTHLCISTGRKVLLPKSKQKTKRY